MTGMEIKVGGMNMMGEKELEGGDNEDNMRRKRGKGDEKGKRRGLMNMGRR